METPEYPPNSFSSKKAPEPKEKNVTRVTSSEPIRRKKSLGRKFKDIFFGGDAKSAGRYVVYSVLIPAAKDMIVEAGSEGIQKLVRGDSYRRRSSPYASPRGYFSYDKVPTRHDTREEPPRLLSSRARSRHDFDEIVLQSRAEAEEVIERMFDIVGRYDTATVADLYDLVGVRSSHVDHKWGWSDMRGAGVVRVRDGYLLELPDVQPMEM
jgi:hypothetical protein